MKVTRLTFVSQICEGHSVDGQFVKVTRLTLVLQIGEGHSVDVVIIDREVCTVGVTDSTSTLVLEKRQE